jgi:hypothetical protein
LVNPDPLDQRRGGAESATQGASFQAGLRGQRYGELNSSGRVALDEETIKDAAISRFLKSGFEAAFWDASESFLFERFGRI